MPLLASRKRTLRVRGIERRGRLLDAAWALLQERELNAISLGDVAERAGIPVGSAYHFYPSIEDVYAALIARVEVELLSLHRVPLRTRPRRWSGLVEEFVDRGIALFEAQPAACKLLIGRHTPPDLKYRDRQNDRALAQILEEKISAVFALPEIADRSEIFYRAIEIADLMFTLSVIDGGALTAVMKLEAKRAAIAYLASYFPLDLPRRPQPKKKQGPAPPRPARRAVRKAR